MTAAIAPLQTLAGAGNLILKGNPYIFDKVARKVSFVGAGVNFTITGIGSPVNMADGNPTQLWGPISEVVAGGAESVNIYTQVISISVPGPAVNVSAGFGTSGITDYVFLDYNRPYFGGSISIYYQTTGAATVDIYFSLDKPQTPNIQFGTLNNHMPIVAFPFASNPITVSTFAPIESPISTIWTNITGTTTDSIQIAVLQQGI